MVKRLGLLSAVLAAACNNAQADPAENALAANVAALTLAVDSMRSDLSRMRLANL